MSFESSMQYDEKILTTIGGNDDGERSVEEYNISGRFSVNRFCWIVRIS